MPAPQAQQMQQLARLKFTSFQIKVPERWRDPTGDPQAKHFADAFTPEEKAATPGAPPLFLPATLNKFHVDSQKMHIDKIGKFIDDICSAICSAWSQWQSMATMTGVMINGPTASAGQIVGPPWQPLIMMQAPKTTQNLLKYSNVIAKVISEGWMQFTGTVKVPGLPWYPAFTALPSPVAPPTPNVPVPFAALTQVPMSISCMGPMGLKQRMIMELGDPNAPYHPQLFEAISDAFEKCYNIWKVSTMVTNVLGTGPVPTFAPPYVPAGPVVGGVGTMTPGGFA
jgi:hypothetical protein